MANKTTTGNLALGHLGFGTEISNLDTDKSEEATALRRFHDTALEITLRDYNWSFAEAWVQLALVEEFDDTSAVKEWKYSFRYPSDALKLRKIWSGIRNDSLQAKVRYRIASDNAGRLIYTDLEEPSLVYTRNVTDYSLFPPDFIMAFSLRWALYVPNRLLAGDPFRIKQDLFAQYQIELSNARANDAMEQVPDEQIQSEFMRERMGDVRNGGFYADD